MAITGGVQFTGFISPTSEDDTYAVTDPKYGLGGLRTVADTSARDAIPSARRQVGMMVFVESNGLYYGLSGGTGNGDWATLGLGSGVGADGATGATGATGSGYSNATISGLTLYVDFTPAGGSTITQTLGRVVGADGSPGADGNTGNTGGTGATGATGSGYSNASIVGLTLYIDITPAGSDTPVTQTIGRVVGADGTPGADGNTGNTGATGTIGAITDFSKGAIDGGFTLGASGLTGINVSTGLSGGIPLFKIGEIGWQRGGETFPETIGGVEAGTSFDNGTSIADIVEAILFPYQSVSFSAFDIGLSSGPYEVGQTAGDSTVNATWSTSGPDANWVASSISISANQGVGTLASGLEYDGSPQSITHGPYNFTSELTLTFTISGQQDQGANPSRTDTMNWRYRYFSGKTGAGFDGTGLTGQGFSDTLSRTSPSNWSVTFAAASPPDKAYFIIPSAEFSGTLSFTDTGTGFAFPFDNGGTFDHVNAYGHTVEYTIFESTNAFAGETTIRVNT